MGEKKSAQRKAHQKPAKARQVQKSLEVPRFDARSFLTSVGVGRSTTAFKPKEIVYRQGDAAGATY